MALDMKLRTDANRQGVPADRLRKLVVFDRLLARLHAVAPDRWIVKGGVALELRLHNRARTTMDLDLIRQEGEDAAAEDLIAIQEVDLGDFFAFVVERKEKPAIDQHDVAVSYHVRAELDGRTFDNVTVDVGIGDRLHIDPEHIEGSGLLAFAQIERIGVLALPLERHVAEKLHAYTRTYGAGQPSSRPKDLIDLVLICSSNSFNSGELRREVEAIFRARGTHPIPSALPLPPAAWRIAYHDMASVLAIDTELVTGHEIAAAFVDPVLGEDVPRGARWDPIARKWSESK
ncbi:MAG TPA: nucleotidyl transferase AbiEii/AbiGii toxin family protein [Thermomicrobiales bacterium]|jgi:hypothetical protein